MNPKSNPQPRPRNPQRPVNTGRDNRMHLPFEGKKRIGFGEWIYRHRVGFLITVIFHMSAAILFLTYQIIIKPVPAPSIAIEMVDEQFQPKPEEQEQQKKEVQKLADAKAVDVANRISDRNAQTAARNLRDDRGTNVNKLDAEMKRVQDELAATKAAYEKGLAGLASGGSGKRSDRDNKTETSASSGRSGSDDKRQTSRSKGNVTVEYDLPGRTDVSLYIPAYECENAGRVIVDITVDQKGRVINASVAATSTQDNCITSMALQAARASTFNASTTAANKQKGTITYLFVAQ